VPAIAASPSATGYASSCASPTRITRTIAAADFMKVRARGPSVRLTVNSWVQWRLASNEKPLPSLRLGGARHNHGLRRSIRSHT
jgi:hypothetical protein